MILKTVEPARGAYWVRDAMRLYMRRPLALTAVFLLYLAAALLIRLVPLLGGVLQAGLVPLLTLGMMIASQQALLDSPVAAAQLVDAFRGAPARRRALLLLCAAYAIGVLAVALLGDLIADGGITKFVELWVKGAPEKEIDALLAQRPLAAGALFVFVALTLLAVPYWHAPALVHWGGQGAWQALFSSTIAVWRCRGAFVVYGLTWFAVVSSFALVTTLVFAVTGLAQVGTMLALPAAMLFFSTLFYVSLIFTFNDSFGAAPGSPVATTLG